MLLGQIRTERKLSFFLPVFVITIIIVIVILGVVTPSYAQEQPYYQGKTLTLYVGRTPGSGADLAARVFSQFWSRHIPGEPTIIVRNLPGGGGTRVWNYGAEIAANDGLHVFFSPTNGRGY